jgi:hypothetical protein
MTQVRITHTGQIAIPWQDNPFGLPLRRLFLYSTAIHVALKSWWAHYETEGREIKRRLLRRPDGLLTFLDGTPVKAHELIPGQEYEVVETPWLQ